MKTLLMAGSFGFGNTGDDAILDAMLADMRALVPRLKVIVVSGNPPETREAYGVEAIHWHDIPQIVNAAKVSDLITLGGGGLFYDYWGFRPESLLSKQHTELAYYTEFALLAALLDKPLMIYAAGVGPLLSQAGRLFTRIAFEQAAVATVRDPDSKALLESLGIEGERVRVTADPAFNFQQVDERRAQQLVGVKVGTPVARPLIGVALRNWDIGVSPDRWEGEVARALDAFLERRGGTAVFVPFQAVQGILTDDLAVAGRVRDRMRYRSRTVQLEQCVPAREKAGVLSCCDVVLGMRLHSVIFAVKHAVPTVALTYDPKVSSLLSQIGIGDYGITPDLLTSETLCIRLEQAYEKRASLAAQARDEVARLATLARHNATLVAELLSGALPAPKAISPEMIGLIKSAEVEQAIRNHDLQQTVEALQAQAAQREQAMEALQARVREITLTLDNELPALSGQLLEREQTLATLSAQLANITGSKSWRLARGLSRLRWLLVPPARRRQILRERPSDEKPNIPPVGASGSIAEDQLSRGPPLHPRAQESLAGSLSSARDFIFGHDNETTMFRIPRGHRKPRVAYLTNRVIDAQTGEPCFGGGERYCLTLSELLLDLGFEVTLFQMGSQSFEAEYHGLEVVSLPAGEGFSEFQYGVCDAFTRASQGYDRVIHNLPEYASGAVRPDALMICHGIWFDHDNYGNRVAYRTSEWFHHLYRAFSQPAKVVSVDTNSINVIRMLWPGLGAKMTYIPNWVDTERFRPPSRPAKSEVVLFPRRSQVNRGSRILEAILKRIPYDWRFLWVGEGDAEDTRIIRELTTRDRRLEFHSASFTEMPSFYQQAEICVIPTLAAEGTSLACLEGLASGSAVVATHVGGLANLIQPGVNGLMVDPTPEAIAAAVNVLIEQPRERQRLRKAGRQTAMGFGLPIWQQRWSALLQQLNWTEPQMSRARTHA